MLSSVRSKTARYLHSPLAVLALAATPLLGACGHTTHLSTVQH